MLVRLSIDQWFCVLAIVCQPAARRISAPLAAIRPAGLTEKVLCPTPSPTRPQRSRPYPSVTTSVSSGMPGRTQQATSISRPPTRSVARRPRGSCRSVYMLLSPPSGSSPSRRAVAGLMSTGLSQTTLVDIWGISWSHALFASRPSPTCAVRKTTSSAPSAGGAGRRKPASARATAPRSTRGVSPRRVVPGTTPSCSARRQVRSNSGEPGACPSCSPQARRVMSYPSGQCPSACSPANMASSSSSLGAGTNEAGSLRCPSSKIGRIIGWTGATVPSSVRVSPHASRYEAPLSSHTLSPPVSVGFTDQVIGVRPRFVAAARRSAKFSSPGAS